MRTTETLAERNDATTKIIFKWTTAWLISLALLAFGPTLLWQYAMLPSVMVILGNVVCGIYMLRANKRHLDALDELQRRVHMNAMAVSLGVSMIFGAIYGLLEGIRLISATPNPSGILFVMGIVYLVSLLIGFRHYE